MTAPAAPARCPLSARELQIVEHVASGYSNSEIGARLGLSPLTVKSHLARVFQTLGASDRAHATAIAFRSGWIS